MRIRLFVMLVGVLFLVGNVNGQKDGKTKFFYDTLVIMDYVTNESSERLSQMKKPLVRSFYLKAEGFDYSLFKGQTAQLAQDQIMTLLDSGMSLYIDKMEHRGRKNLKPGLLEIIGDDGEVENSIDLSNAEEADKLGALTKGALVRFSGFVVSVNEEKLGPIILDVKVTE